MCCASPPLSHHDSVFMSLILLSEALFLPLNQFPSWGLIKLNWIELNMSWSRYEDAKAVWHRFSNTEMKYNVLILNASDRINCNDLRFFPGEFSAQPPLVTHVCTHTQLWCNCLGRAGESWRTHSSKSLISKCYCWCSFESAASSGLKRYCLCQHRVLAGWKCNNMLCVALVFPSRLRYLGRGRILPQAMLSLLVVNMKPVCNMVSFWSHLGHIC